MYYLVGFIIAIAVGLTGIGGGSFTVPALVLLTGLTAGEAVGTAFLFAGVLRLIAAPFYLLGKQIHSRYLWLLLQGAVPGLLVGTWALRILNRDAGNPYVIVLLGVLLAASSSVTFIRRVQNPAFAGKNHRWLPWLALPIGMESGFSSAGAGALGACWRREFPRTSLRQLLLWWLSLQDCSWCGPEAARWLPDARRMPLRSPHRQESAMRASQPHFAKEFLPVALSEEVLRPLLALRSVIHACPCC